MCLLDLELFIHVHGGSVGAILVPGLPGYRSLLVDHLPRHRNDVVFDQVLADVLDVCSRLAYHVQDLTHARGETHTLLRIHLANVSCLQLVLA